MKNDGTYFLYLRFHDGREDTRYCPDMVYPFKWNDIEFFAHRPYDAGVPMVACNYWEVTNKETGMNLELAQYCIATIKSAQDMAIKKLEKHGLDLVKAGIQRIRDGKYPPKPMIEVKK